MPQSGETDASAIASEIERYLSIHPDAADTLTGIRSWWLPPDASDVPTSVIEQALALLITRRVVVRRRLPDGGVLYASGRHDPRNGS